MTCASRGAEVRSRRVPLDTDPSSDSEILTSEPGRTVGAYGPDDSDMAVRNGSGRPQPPTRRHDRLGRALPWCGVISVTDPTARDRDCAAGPAWHMRRPGTQNTWRDSGPCWLSFVVLLCILTRMAKRAGRSSRQHGSQPPAGCSALMRSALSGLSLAGPALALLLAAQDALSPSAAIPPAMQADGPARAALIRAGHCGQAHIPGVSSRTCVTVLSTAPPRPNVYKCSHTRRLWHYAMSSPSLAGPARGQPWRWCWRPSDGLHGRSGGAGRGRHPVAADGRPGHSISHSQRGGLECRPRGCKCRLL